MAYIMFDDNQVVITGKIAMDFTFSHKICGECFYKAELQVKRLSDSVDTIPVLISEQFMGNFIHIIYVKKTILD